MGPTKSREFVRVKFEGGGRAGPLASGSCGQGGGRGAGHGCHDGRQVEKVAARGLASQDTRPGLPSSPNHTSGEPEEADQPAGKVPTLTLSLRNSHMYLLLLLILFSYCIFLFSSHMYLSVHPLTCQPAD